MKIHIHIERLVVDGLPAEAAAGGMLGAAVEARVSELLRVGGLPPALAVSKHVASVRAPPLRADPARGAAHLGASIGDAIHGAVARGT